MVKWYVPLVPPSDVPARAAVPSPLSVKETPLGNGPDSVKLGVGEPVAVTVKLLYCPVAKVTLLLLVMAGAWFTVSVKVWLTLPPLLAAVKFKV